MNNHTYQQQLPYKAWTFYQLKNERTTWCHLLFYFTSYVLNMFWTLIYPSSGACNCVAELPHRSSYSQFIVCWSFGAAGFGWCSFYRLQPATRALHLCVSFHLRPLQYLQRNHESLLQFIFLLWINLSFC